MKVSWRTAMDSYDVFPHEQIFIPGKSGEGKSPREFIIWLIKKTPATGVCVNDKQIWKNTDFGADPDKVATLALMGEPRQAQVAITIDYNIQDDWIDKECRSCGFMYSLHSHDCPDQIAIDTAWLDMLSPHDEKQIGQVS